jgi:hypothetical protein
MLQMVIMVFLKNLLKFIERTHTHLYVPKFFGIQKFGNAKNRYVIHGGSIY